MEKNKFIFAKASVEVIKFGTSDVIVTSAKFECKSDTTSTPEVNV